LRTILGRLVHAVDNNNNSIIILMEDKVKKTIAFKTEGELVLDDSKINYQIKVQDPLLPYPFKLVRKSKHISKVGSFNGLTSDSQFEQFFISFTSSILPGQWKLYTLPNKKLFFTRLR
jgi:hypothetical protein